MAESSTPAPPTVSVEGPDGQRDPLPPRPNVKFFCHSCDVEIDSVSEEYTCLLCGKGFIEEVAIVHPDPDDSMDYTVSDMSAQQAQQDDDMQAQQNFFPFLPQEINSQLTEEISSLLMSVTGVAPPHDPAGGSGSGGERRPHRSNSIQVTSTPQPHHHHHHHHHHRHPQYPLAGGSGTSSSSNGGGSGSGSSSAVPSSSSGPAGGVASASGGGPSGSLNFSVGLNPRSNPSRRFRQRNLHDLHNLDNIVQDFLISVTGGTGAAGGPLYFMSNPADYVYGRDGLDTIVTQLLNQMDGTGPAPLAHDKIAEIPSVLVTAEQVEEKLQCSVCWEDFQLAEKVRKLPCVHIFHEPCIVPWLELHATCPVCRQVLNPESSEEQQQSVVNDMANSLRNVAALYQNPDRTTADSSSGGTVSAPNTSGSSSGSGHGTPFTGAGRNSILITSRSSHPSLLARNLRRQSEPPQTELMRDEDGNVEFDFD